MLYYCNLFKNCAKIKDEEIVISRHVDKHRFIFFECSHKDNLECVIIKSKFIHFRRTTVLLNCVAPV